ATRQTGAGGGHERRLQQPPPGELLTHLELVPWPPHAPAHGARSYEYPAPMASIEGVRNRLKEWKPFVQPAFLVYVVPRKSPVPPEQIDHDFTVSIVNTPDDPLLPKVCA